MSSKLLTCDKCIFLETLDSEKLYLFKPKIYRLYPKSGDMRNMTWRQYCRFLLMLIHGYRVYIITDICDVVKGSITFSTGGLFIYPFTSKNDLIEGPSYTIPEFRGQGVAVRISNIVLSKYESNYHNVYAVISKSNNASIRRVLKNGFILSESISVDRFHRYVFDPNGALILVKK